jgi:hypothetical protein
MTVTSPPGALRRRHLKQYQRRALTLLAGCGSAGCDEAVVSAHGFTADQLAQMVRVGFAAKTSEPVVGSVGQTFEIKRFKITGASERWVINGERVPPTLCHLPGFHGLGDEQIGAMAAFAESWTCGRARRRA